MSFSTHSYFCTDINQMSILRGTGRPRHDVSVICMFLNFSFLTPITNIVGVAGEVVRLFQSPVSRHCRHKDGTPLALRHFIRDCWATIVVSYRYFATHLQIDLLLHSFTRTGSIRFESEFRSCVKVEMAVLDFPSLISLMVCGDVKPVPNKPYGLWRRKARP